MPRYLLPMIPEYLLIEQVLPELDHVVILSCPKSLTSVCPLCSAASVRVHSHYQRTLADESGRAKIPSGMDR